LLKRKDVKMKAANDLLDPAELTAASSSHLFKGISNKDIKSLMPCLTATKKKYKKNETIINEGAHLNTACLLLSGSAHIERIDFSGTRNIVNALTPGDVFGESYAASSLPVSVSVISDADTTVLFLNMTGIIHMCGNACPFHSKLLENLLRIMSVRNLNLNDKITIITQKSLRAKIMMYLNEISKRSGSTYFDIPFSRQQLADYLNADRSALSSALSSLKADGVIDFQKNHFRII
jgi:CRP-like cAMP-binding protein